MTMGEGGIVQFELLLVLVCLIILISIAIRKTKIPLPLALRGRRHGSQFYSECSDSSYPA